MNYIVLDMEWNQPYNAKVVVRENVSLCGEIIQIGAVKLDENFNTISEFDIMIAPKYYKKMHEYVARITKITTQELQEQGVPFVDAFYKFKSWCGSDFIFLTWGPDDVGILRDNMSAYGFDTDWLPDSYDAQMIFAHQITSYLNFVFLRPILNISSYQHFTSQDFKCFCIKGILNILPLRNNKRHRHYIPQFITSFFPLSPPSLYKTYSLPYLEQPENSDYNNHISIWFCRTVHKKCPKHTDLHIYSHTHYH